MKKYTFKFGTPFIVNDFQFHVADFNDFELQSMYLFLAVGLVSNGLTNILIYLNKEGLDYLSYHVNR